MPRGAYQRRSKLRAIPSPCDRETGESGPPQLSTTDTSFDGEAKWWPEVELADVEYLLAPLANYVAGEPLTSADVVSSWAGLRPLIHEPGKAAKEMSRKEEVWQSANGMITIAGGKLTGFRKMAEEVMAKVGKALDVAVKLEDPLAPLPSGDFGDDAFRIEEQVARVAGRYQLDNAAATRLVRLYGSEVQQVLGDNPQLITSSIFAEEIDWAVLTDGARQLEDLVYRRLRTAWYEPAELDELLPLATERMAQLLDWDAQRQQRERAATEQRLAADLAAIPH